MGSHIKKDSSGFTFARVLFFFWLFCILLSSCAAAAAGNESKRRRRRRRRVQLQSQSQAQHSHTHTDTLNSALTVTLSRCRALIFSLSLTHLLCAQPWLFEIAAFAAPRCTLLPLQSPSSPPASPTSQSQSQSLALAPKIQAGTPTYSSTACRSSGGRGAA